MMVSPTSPYWPCTPGSWQEYYAYYITGVFHPTTGQLDVLSTTRAPVADCRRTYMAMPDALFPSIGIAHTPMGVAPDPDWRWTSNTLVESIGAVAGGSGCIGEVGSFQGYAVPATSMKHQATAGLQPEPQCPLIATEYMDKAVDGTSNGSYWDTDTGAVVGISNTWRFWNLGPGSGPNGTWFWPQYPDQIRTLLIERPDTFQNENVYQYLFAKDVGLLCEWTIERGKDNTGSGWMRQIGAHS